MKFINSFLLAFLFVIKCVAFPIVDEGKPLQNTSYNDSILFLQHTGHLQEAITLSQEWISVTRETHGENSINMILPLVLSARYDIGRKEFSLALERLNEALEIMDNTTGWLYPDYGRALNYKVICMSQLGDDFGCIPLLNEIEMIYQKTLGKEHIDYGLTYISHALVEQSLGKFELAEEYFEKGLKFNDECVQKYNRPFLKQEWIEILLSQLYIDWYKEDKALAILKKVEVILEEEKLQQSPLYAHFLFTIGNAEILKENYINAYLYFDNYQKYINNHLGKQHPSYVVALYKIAQLSKLQSQFATEERLLLYLEGKLVNTKNYDLYVRTLLDLATIYLHQGRTEKAEEYLAKTKGVPFSDNKLRHYTLRTEGNICLNYGDYINAELKLTELISIIRQERIHYSHHYNQGVISTVDLDLILGRKTEALKAVQTELNFLKKRKMDSTIDYYKILLSKYKVQLYINDTTNLYENVEALKKSLSDKGLPIHYLLVKANFIQGKLLVKRKEYDLAMNKFNETQMISKKLGIQHDEFYNLRIIEAQANIFLSEKKYAEAYTAYMKLKGSFKESSIYQPGLSARIAYLQAMQGDINEAEKTIIEATNKRFQQYDENLKFSSEDEKIKYIHNTKSVFDYFFTMVLANKDNLSDRMIKQCYNIQLNYRKYFLTEAQERKNKIDALVDIRKEHNLSTYVDELYHMKSQLAAINYMSDEERNELYFDLFTSNDKINNLEKSLVYASNALDDQLDIPPSFNWEDIAEKLDEKDVAIEIIKLLSIDDNYNDQYIALMIKKGDESPSIIALGNSDHLEFDGWFKYQHETSPSNRSLVYSSKKSNSGAYNYFWKPIQNHIDSLGINVENYYISNDGVYNVINLNVLKNPTTKKFLLQEANIHLLTSTAELLDKKEDQFINKDILLVGNPSFQKEIQISESDGKEIKQHKSRGTNGYYFDLENLPGTQKEITNAEKVFNAKGWNVTSYTKDQALEAKFKEINNSPSIIHIATHGFFIDQMNNPVSSNNLLKSGLFFTEIAQREDRKLEDIYFSGNDGILTAYEVKSLNLTDTQLLILSACQSGLSEIADGDGISGLQYAFSIAGVKSIIMSLWSVDDHATQLLMNTFYEEWVKTNDKQLAFKNAQLIVMKEYPKPYYWGAFVLVN
ncbi:CHAT domain-containing protein [Flammeovirga kamogawensis]|uniref:CHAT domain-containing protein n=1 Tax=Flammeovirga kamogawensis TaxID=373891 RepID=UPI0011835168|nr:CHAT domain-containing tetratricopeptide repeat protein [Flammeovirga kamogawensis]MBB6462616.1 CHAT domain-containing protein [Flammeovirga kamogawensis]TRX65153.1 CHAT domain-containing protein [Flammeovirga kamogawensis]